MIHLAKTMCRCGSQNSSVKFLRYGDVPEANKSKNLNKIVHDLMIFIFS